jgi:hypothetical protein
MLSRGIAGALVVMSAATASAGDGDGATRVSLPTEADRIAWQASGLRLGLGLALGEARGLHGAPSGRLIGLRLHIGVRLDDEWSMLTTFQYAAASRHDGLSGLQFQGTVDPTWHVTPSLALAVGMGFAGFVEGNTGRADTAPQATDVSITIPIARDPISSCSGLGVTGLARATWSYVIGPHASTGIELEVFDQFTRCVQDNGLVDPDTAQPIARTQYWTHEGITLSVGVTWR